MTGDGLPKDLVLYNGTVLTPWREFHGGVIVRDGLIEAVFKGAPPAGLSAGRVDCRGGCIMPGFIDIHLHGARGHDFGSASVEGILEAARFHAVSGGTTALLPSVISAPLPQLNEAAARIRRARRETDGPEILGLHLEGPFLNPAYQGAHPANHLLDPTPALVAEIINMIKGLPAVVTLAPELPGGPEAVSSLSRRGIVPALGHSAATYADVLDAAGRGLRHAVHTYSAMRGFHHREPGALGAVLTLDELSAELIADGIHTAPAAVKLFFRAKPPDKTVLVTDSFAGTGLPGGEFRLGDRKVTVNGGQVRLADGTLAGSTLTMNRALACAAAMSSLDLRQILPAATANPAAVLGLSSRKGSLAAGKDADVVVLDRSLNVLLTICRGRPLKPSALL